MSSTNKRIINASLSPSLKKKKKKHSVTVHRKFFKDIPPTEDDIVQLNAQPYKFMGNTTQRKVCFFGEFEGIPAYQYAGNKHKARPFTPWIQRLAAKIRECYPQAEINCCNVNVYPLGTSGALSRHQDDEPMHVSDKIWSCSFGGSANMMIYAGKKGRFIEKTQLLHCDLAMFDRMRWHSIGSSKQVQNVRSRINITFRKFKITM